MLCLDRNIKESIIIDEKINIMILNLKISKDCLTYLFSTEEEQLEAIRFFHKILPGLKVRLGISAPTEVRILRSEIYEKEKKQLDTK